MNETIRTILELIGVLESPRTALKRKLALISQAKEPGQVTLLVKSLGAKQNSAMSAIREITGLNLPDVVTFVGMLPAPLLTHVALETAVAAQKILTVMGVESEIVGAEKGASQNPPPAQKTTTRARRPFLIQPGNYTVTLTAVGLLGERVLAGVQQITGRPISGANALEAALPLIVLTNVDQDTAVRAQTLLQMVGAVVDIDEAPG